MKPLLFFLTCLATFYCSFAQQQALKKKYYCTPCGCTNDGKLLDSGGKCPACGMHLLEAGTYNYEMASVSDNGIIVYSSNQINDKQNLFYKKINSSAAGKLVTEGSMPHISGDGKKVVFNRGENNISIYEFTTGKLTDIGSKIDLPGLQTPAWGSNSIIFAAGTFPNIGIYKYDTTNEKTEPIIADSGFRYGCVLSPDGKKIAYRCVKGKPGPERQRGLAIFDLATKEEKLITPIGEYGTWSPDGEKLAFHWPDSSDYCVYTINVDGTALKKIAGVKGSDCELPVWSADGKKIFFQTNRRRGNWEIWTMNTDGSNQQPLIWK